MYHPQIAHHGHSSHGHGHGAHAHAHGLMGGFGTMHPHQQHHAHPHLNGHHAHAHHASGVPFSHAAHDLLSDFGYTANHKWGPDESAIKYSYDITSNKWTEEHIVVRLRAPAKARGGMRAVYDCEVITKEGPVVCVAKVSLNAEDSEDVYFLDAKMQNICAKWASDFNAENPPKLVSVLPCGVVTIPTRRNRFGRQMYFHLEPLLQGTYKKYTNNFGFADANAVTAQAFSHFTFNASHQSLLVCDIQGVGDVYTDPQIHSMTAIGCVWGKGDMGRAGIEQFFKCHRCNHICDFLNLVHPHDTTSPNLAYTPRSRCSTVSTPRSSPAYGPGPRTRTPTPTQSSPPISPDGPLISACEIAEKSTVLPPSLARSSSPQPQSVAPPVDPGLPKSATYTPETSPQFIHSVVPTRYSSDLNGKNKNNSPSTEDRADLSPDPTAHTVPVMDKSGRSSPKTTTRIGHPVIVTRTVLPKKRVSTKNKHNVRTSATRTPKSASPVPQDDVIETLVTTPAASPQAPTQPRAGSVSPPPTVTVATERITKQTIERPASPKHSKPASPKRERPASPKNTPTPQPLPEPQPQFRPQPLAQPAEPPALQKLATPVKPVTPLKLSSPAKPASPASPALRAGQQAATSLTKMRSTPASIFDYSCERCGNKQAIESVAPLPPNHWAFGECSKCKNSNTFRCISECM